MYDAVPDPYVYPGTSVLKNRLNIRDPVALEQFEAASVTERGAEPLPVGRFSVTHYRAIHRYLFQDVYSWAGNYRSVRLAKGNSVFCYPENISVQMNDLFSSLRTNRFFRGNSVDEFVSGCTTFLGMLNAIHPFRDGNGRSQLAFVAALGSRAEHPLNLTRLRSKPFLAAMVRSFAPPVTCRR